MAGHWSYSNWPEIVLAHMETVAFRRWMNTTGYGGGELYTRLPHMDVINQMHDEYGAGEDEKRECDLADVTADLTRCTKRRESRSNFLGL